MDMLPREVNPLEVDSVDRNHSTKKAGKTKHFVNKLRSSLSRKSLGSTGNYNLGEDTLGRKEKGKERAKTKTKKNFEKRVSSSLRRLRKKLSRSEGRTVSDTDIVDTLCESEGGTTREVKVDEVVATGRSNVDPDPTPRNAVVAVDPGSGSEHERMLHFVVQADGKLPEGVPRKCVKHSVVGGSEPHAIENDLEWERSEGACADSGDAEMEAKPTKRRVWARDPITCGGVAAASAALLIARVVIRLF